MSYSTAGSQVVFGIAQTWKLASNGDFVALSEPRLLDPWSHIVPTVNGLVLFYGPYAATAATAATGLITPEGAFRDLKRLDGLRSMEPRRLHQRRHPALLQPGDGRCRNRKDRGCGRQLRGPSERHARSRVASDRAHHQWAPALLSVWATADPAPEAVVGRINPSTGAYGDVSLVNGLERWDKIVSVLSLPPITGKI